MREEKKVPGDVPGYLFMAITYPAAILLGVGYGQLDYPSREIVTIAAIVCWYCVEFFIRRRAGKDFAWGYKVNVFVWLPIGLFVLTGIAAQQL